MTADVKYGGRQGQMCRNLIKHMQIKKNHKQIKKKHLQQLDNMCAVFRKHTASAEKDNKSGSRYEVPSRR